MKQHEIDGELAQDGAQELLTAPHLCHVAYTGTDGTPRVIPILVDLAEQAMA